MYSFMNDYNEIAHENILNAIVKNNMVQTLGYGEDEFCDRAKEIIKQRFSAPDCDVHFFMAGTSTNLTLIDMMLRNYEAIISTDTAHINVHEVSAIESCGHKILTVPNKNGKLTADDIENTYLSYEADEHMVLPKAVYISNSTELGTVYKKEEIKAIFDMCKKYNLYLYIDGARLGTALTSRESDLEISDLAKYSDAFYIGGTKNGALLGEVLVIKNDALKANFFRQMKCKGAVHAKAKVMGIEFIELFKDDLYFELARHANKMAYKIYDCLREKYEFLAKVESNQIFIILDNKIIEKMREKFVFALAQKMSDDKSCIRLVTSWATKEEEVDRLIEFLKQEK